MSRRAAACRGADSLAAITSFKGDLVTFLNVRSLAVEATTPVGRAPWGVAWTPNGAHVFVTNRKDGNVSVIDVVSHTVVGTVSVGPQPLGVAVHPFLPRAYVTSYDDDRVRVIDTRTLAVVDVIHVGNGPAGIAVHPSGSEIYVANYVANKVSVINAATNAVIATVATPARPVGIAVAPDGTKVYVACFRAREVAIVGIVNHSLLGTIRVGGGPVGVAFATNNRAYVTNSADDSVTVLDTSTDHAIAKVSVGRFPLGIAVTADGTVFVAEGKSDALAVLDDGGATLGTLPVANTPVAIGSFIGTPPSDCPSDPLSCDDANPYTGDACAVGAGCTTTPIEGLAGVRAGVAAMQAIIEDAAESDPIAAVVAGKLGALESALSAAETDGSDDGIRVVRRSLKPILKTLTSARRQGTLGRTGARLLDIAREALKHLQQLGHGR